ESGAQDRELDAKIKGKEESLKQIRAQIESCRGELDRLRGKETGILDSLRTVEKELSLLGGLLSKLDSRQKELEWEIDRARSDLSITEKRLEVHRRRLVQRLRQMYKRGRSQLLEALFTASSPVDLFRRYKYVCAAAEADKRVLSEVEREKAYLERTRDELNAKLAENRRLRREKEQEEARAHHLRARRNHHLAVVRTQLSASKQAMKELEEEAEQIEAIIGRLEKERRRRIAAQKKAEDVKVIYEHFARYRGRLPWPTKGRILSAFGLHRHPVLKTTTVNKGINIRAPFGADILAVAPGRVIMTDWLRGYGKFLIIDHHNGYYTLYAHTSEILVAEGDEVDGGEIIAKVGDTGSLQGSMLHFEIREGTRELDPMDWLREE
ncbi:MAG: murein hydrolase activator EnvC family protein, partial [bacterium]